jgi:hypothetical protein
MAADYIEGARPCVNTPGGHPSSYYFSQLMYTDRQAVATLLNQGGALSLLNPSRNVASNS